MNGAPDFVPRDLFRLLCDAEADEGDHSPGMMAVGGGEDVWCGVGGALGTGGGEDVGDEMVGAGVAAGVGDDVADGGLGGLGWERAAMGAERIVRSGGV